MTKGNMIEWFKSAPMSSRHQRMLWAAQNIARLTGATEGGAYQLRFGFPRDAPGGDGLPARIQ